MPWRLFLFPEYSFIFLRSIGQPRLLPLTYQTVNNVASDVPLPFTPVISQISKMSSLEFNEPLARCHSAF